MNNAQTPSVAVEVFVEIREITFIKQTRIIVLT